jgi:hypothetical protein
MRLVPGHGRPDEITKLESAGESGWPLDARVALFMLESACEVQTACPESPSWPRALDRFRCRVRGWLRRRNRGAIESEEIYLRDISTAHAGFITHQPLEIGGEYVLEFAPAGRSPMCVTCTVGRCRPFMDGGQWSEGVLHLHQGVAQEAASELNRPVRIAV